LSLVEYREHPPSPALAPWVACTWERRDGGGPPVRVVPDGCIDLVWTQGRGATVVGANTTAFLVGLPAGVRVAGVRMRPGAGAALLGVDAGALRDARIPLEDLWHDDARRLEERLESVDDRVGVLLAALGARAPWTAPPDPLVRVAVRRLHDPGARVETLARELDVSARQLRRRFESAVGYGPKRLARVLRLERALAVARGGEGLAWAAAAAGYADQAHFAHDCRALAGVSPSALLA
jgi:AraC-like DNA-binding protein